MHERGPLKTQFFWYFQNVLLWVILMEMKRLELVSLTHFLHDFEGQYSLNYILLKEMRNIFLWTPQKSSVNCLSHEIIKKNWHKKVIACFNNLSEENF